MKYDFILGFMYDVGYGVGEFLEDEEREGFIPMTLLEIVKEYVDDRGLLTALVLKRQIRKYIKSHMTDDGLAYADDPFNQELCFAEDYFEGDLLVFLDNVTALLNDEVRMRMKRFFRFARP
jgi:hypothetical protein